MKTEAEIERILTRPLPAEAIKPPNNKGLSSIKNIYITERLNEAYGRGQWSLKATDMGAEMWVQKTTKGEREMYTGKAHVRITLPNGTELECIATSQNDDEGDASKGAISDCISKIGSWLGIGSHIWKGQTLEQAWSEWNNAGNAERIEKARRYIVENSFESAKCGEYMMKLNAMGCDVVALATKLHKELQDINRPIATKAEE